MKDTDSSSSIADTEFWPSEEVDEEEVIHIEIDDGSKELLPKDREDKRKLGRINRIVGAVARIPWLGKGEVRIILSPPNIFIFPDHSFSSPRDLTSY